MSVLIFTHSEENESVAGVARVLGEMGHEVVRYDTDLFPTARGLAAAYGPDGERLTLEIDGRDVDLGSVTAIWNRRFYTGRSISKELDPQLRQPSVEESRRSLFGLVACLDVFCLDPLREGHYARHKPLQLQIARELGLDLPHTLITNQPEKVREFAAAHPGGIVTKMMTSFAVYDDEGRESVVFTNPLSAEDLADLSGLDVSPMTFQERVPKALELRVTVVGHRVFSAAIDSQSSARATHDWRRDGAEMVDRWQAYDLPGEVRDRLLGLCDRLGLNYGAIDLILTPDGRHVFLEINPVGEYFWLETWPGFPISQAVAEVLVDPSKRRLSP